MTKRTPQEQQKFDNALKLLDDFAKGRLPKETRTPEQIKADREARIDKSIADRNERYRKDLAASRARDRANLSELEKEYAELSAIRKKGKNWQYADYDQNMTPEERKAREIEPTLLNLARRISAAKSDTSYSKGGKINLKDCKVSTHEKKSKSKNCW